MNRFAKYIAVAVCAVTAIVLGTAYSAFVFHDTTSEDVDMEPAVENIRQNFVFGEDDDVNIFDTKYYNVHFMSQAASSQSENAFYSTSNTNNPTYTTNGYSPVFGQFRTVDTNDAAYNDWVEELRGFGAVVNTRTNSTDYSAGTYVNEVVFRHVSSINVEMLRALGHPSPVGGRPDSDRYSGSTDRGSLKLIDNSGWSYDFLCWATESFSIQYERNGSRGSGNFGWSYGNGIYRALGSFPTSETSPTIPNFNLPLSYYDTTDDKSATDIYFYPFYSPGKNYYRSSTGTDNNGYLYDSISLSDEDETDNSYTSNSNIFSLDNEVKDKTFPNDSSINCYRLAGIDIKSGGSSKIRIRNDIDRQLGSWPGLPTYIRNSGESVVYYDPKGSSNSDGTAEDYIFNPSSLPEGRYTFYLFVKESHVQYTNNLVGVPQHADELTVSTFDDEELKTAKAGLNRLNIHSYYATHLGQTKLVSYEYRSITGTRYVYERSGRDYMLIVERSYETKLLGGSNATYDYNSASGIEPLFVQNPDDMRQYEATNVTMNGQRSANYELTDASGNALGTLTLPDTFFSIALDSTDAHDIDIMTFVHDGEDAPTHSVDGSGNLTALSTDGNGHINVSSEFGEFPYVTVRSVATDGTVSDTRDEYYFGKKYSTASNSVDIANSLMKIGELYSSEQIADGYLQGEGHIDPARITVDGTEYGLAEYLRANGNENIYSALSALPIVKVPTEGEYNLYLHLDFESGNSANAYRDTPSITVFAYRIHNIFVKIVDGDIKMSNVTDANGSVVGQFADIADGSYMDTSGNCYCYSSQKYYYLYQTLSLDDSFGTQQNWTKLGDLFSGWYTTTLKKCLKDIVTGQYITPWSMLMDPFYIRKNYMFQVVEWPGESVIPYGQDILYEWLKTEHGETYAN